MFTGLVEALGQVSALSGQGRSRIIVIETTLGDLAPGDSLAVNGACLTLERVEEGRVTAHISAETMRLTNFSALRLGDAVNLERALPLGGRLGGHLVSGHIDALARLMDITTEDDSLRLSFTFPEQFSRYVAAKGSVALDGVSLTVNRCAKGRLEVNIIPATQQATTLAAWRPGRQVNMETDLLAKYVESLLGEKGATGLNEDFLKQHGFV